MQLISFVLWLCLMHTLFVLASRLQTQNVVPFLPVSLPAKNIEIQL